MSIRILIAVDDSENALRAVRQAARLFPADSQITLLSILEDTSTLCDIQSPELTAYFLSQRSSFCILEEKKKSLIRDAMQKAKDQLVEAGFNPDRIKISTQTKQSSIAKDIVKKAEEGFDLLVMGRRGLSGIKELFAGSISNKVLHMAKNISIMLVD